MSTFRERIQQIQTELSAIADEVSAVPQPSPGYGGPPVTPVPAVQWWRSPGSPYVKGEAAADNPQRAKELAAQWLRVDGSPSAVAAQDRPAILALADFLNDGATTAQAAESKINGAAYTPTDSATYQVLEGMFQGTYPASLGGAPTLMYPSLYLSDIIHTPGVPVGGNVA